MFLSMSFKKAYLFNVSLFVLFVGLSFFPLAAYFLSVLLLFVFNSVAIYRIVRYPLLLTSVFSLFSIYLSRDFSSEIEHDLSVYFYEYKKMYSGDWSAYEVFGGGFEIGYHFLYSALSSILPDLTETGLAAVNVLLVVFALIVWVEKYIISDARYTPDTGIIYALIIMFAGFVSFGYLQRQSLSVVFLLFALTSRSGFGFLFFTGLSTLFHLTSLPLILFYKFIVKLNLARNSVFFIAFFVVVLFFLIRLNFYSIINFVVHSGFEFPGVHKLDFYLSEKFSILSFKDLVLNFSLLLMLFLNWSRVDIFWRNIILFSFLSYLVFLGIPLFSERLNFILFFIYGFFAYLVLIKSSINMRNVFIFKFLIALYFFLFCLKNIFMTGIEGYEYWVKYSYFDKSPFYYVCSWFDILFERPSRIVCLESKLSYIL